MNQSCAKWKPSISSAHSTLTENTFLHRPVVSLFWSLSVYSLKDPNCVSVESLGKSGGCVYAFFFCPAFFFSVFFSSLNQGIFQHAQTVWGCICVFVSNKTSKWSWIKIILYKRLVQICCQLHIQKFPLSLSSRNLRLEEMTSQIVTTLLQEWVQIWKRCLAALHLCQERYQNTTSWVKSNHKEM